MWEPYKAARTALGNTIEMTNVERHASHHINKVPKLERTILGLLKEGVLHREYVLDNVPKLIHTMREANVTIRWLMYVGSQYMHHWLVCSTRAVLVHSLHCCAASLQQPSCDDVSLCLYHVRLILRPLVCASVHADRVVHMHTWMWVW